jgi:hypothetical protein
MSVLCATEHGFSATEHGFVNSLISLGNICVGTNQHAIIQAKKKTE